MLRERRRVLNQSVKPNRRLDRKSSRGMVFENEELRLRTINISADVERGQSDIRKLRRENELLRREIWTLRDEYDRLDKLLQDHHQRQLTRENSDENHTHHHHHHHHHDSQHEYSDNSTCDDETESSSDSCGKCTIIENYRQSHLDDETGKVENSENSPKSDDGSGKLDGVHTLSTVSEETGGNSEITDFVPSPIISENIQWTESQLNADHSMTLTSFKMGGNLEELLTDIANLSHDIRKLQLRGNNLEPTGSNEYINYRPDILTTSVSMGSLVEKENENTKKPFRSEVNLILSPLNIDENADDISNDSPVIIPPPLPLLIGFEKFVEEKIPTLHAEPQKIPEPQPSTNLKSTDSIRKRFIKSPSFSLNEKPSTEPHSKDKRLSLDIIPVQAAENTDSRNSTAVETNGKTRTPQRRPSTPATPKSKKTRNLGIFFTRNKKDKTNKNKDDDDDFYYPPINQMNTAGGLRTTAKQQKQLFKMKTKNPKLRKQQMQQQQYRRNIIENRKSENSNNSKKYARLSIVENFIDDNNGGEGGSGDESKSDKSSAEGGSENRSSNESTSSSFRSRKLSITSFTKGGSGGGDKIPWCACWGNGCF